MNVFNVHIKLEVTAMIINDYHRSEAGISCSSFLFNLN